MKDRRIKTGALAVGAAIGVASSADAAVFNVTSNGDNGANTLRQAIIDANANAGADTITFDASLSGNTITLTTGEMLISDTVDIQGLGSANLTIDADAASRVFYIYNPSATPIDVTISGLTLDNGMSVVVGDPPASSGGAIRVIGENVELDDVNITDSTSGGDGGGLAFFGIDNTSSYNPVSAVLTIQNSTISGNDAEFIDAGNAIYMGGCGGGVWAGGIYNVALDNVTLSNNRARCDGGGFFGTYFQDGGDVTIQNSVITGNDTGEIEFGNGGGVGFSNYSYFEANATITDTTISGNSAIGEGGGVYAGFLTTLTISRSTISGNTTAGGGGGGIMLYATNATIENSTIAENETPGWGGGVYALYDTEVTIKETTISGNTAGQDGPGVYAYYYSTANIVNSIVANNGPGADLVNDSSSGFNVGFSLIENEDVADITNLGGNIFGVDPQLGPLQDNGGPTFTMKPASASQAVNAGDPAFAPPPATDQRGFDRTVGTIDMGSVELNPGTLQFSIVSQNVNENVTPAVVNVTRTGGQDGSVSAQITVDGLSTATGGGSDYTFAGAMVMFPDNDLGPAVVNVTIVNDPDDEPNETVILNLGSFTGGATAGAPASHTVTILDDDLVVPASADLSITKAVAPGSVNQFDNVTFNITVTNNGPDAASNVVVTDTLPVQLQFVSATPSAGSCGNVGPAITCNLGALNASASATIQIVATMMTAGPTTNTANVASDTTDNDPVDNQGSATFTILAAPASIPIPALDPRMQLLLAAIVAAVALGMLGKR